MHVLGRACGAEYLPGGPSHSCHVLGQGQTWNRGTLKQTQHSCHACSQVGGAAQVTWDGPENPTASFATSIPRALTEDEARKWGTSRSPPMTPGTSRSPTQPGRHLHPLEASITGPSSSPG